MRGEWDSQRTYITRGIVPAANGHEMYMYYMGTNEPLGWDRDDRNNQLLTKGGVNPVPERRAISTGSSPNRAGSPSGGTSATPSICPP